MKKKNIVNESCCWTLDEKHLFSREKDFGGYDYSLYQVGLINFQLL